MDLMAADFQSLVRLSFNWLDKHLDFSMETEAMVVTSKYMKEYPLNKSDCL
ncbi:hypothetical protein SLEP1_g32891 [Rubroshorea leprosula]|uniref:Uncharacterized protein n=1 Tax=Rubroshorea leprosula TaxID=152421 RepID=A0AAV5KEU1_9ROSI|nr:hypothetical protein SLEP1_g32891 [Rubroshorea leprosula]